VQTQGDFTADRRLIVLSALAVVIGAFCAVVAVVLLKLIYLFTHLFFYQRIAFTPIGPAEHHLGIGVVPVPVVGGLIIGLMARYGSDRIRGHGIPEALEAILIGRSRMQPKVAVLKPLSSAISIGSGGPFGAEGPIIMTGGACGSIIGQIFHLTAAERKTLLVAGAAGGMSATFATPVAAVLLAVELLLFEWKPRSLVPVAFASAVAAALRPFLLEPGPLFAVPAHPPLPPSGLLACVLVGLMVGVASCLLTWGVYFAEDQFHRLPLHWMWWPAIGGLFIGIGGLFEPRAMGVGYDLIRELLQGRYVPAVLAGLLIAKALIWILALGSGTSGGVLAPLLIMGGSLGALAAPLLPGHDHALWPLISMAAILGGTMRSPLTGVVFALELTFDVRTLLPLLIACVTSHAFTVLALRRSILTEKVARRGYHLSREYTVDPLESLRVADVMTPDVVAVASWTPVSELEEQYFGHRNGRRHQGYPVVDAEGLLIGVVTRSNLIDAELDESSRAMTGELIEQPPVVARPEETCRAAAERMADAGVGRLPVVAGGTGRQLVGIITRSDLLKARLSYLDHERRRERLLQAPWQRGDPTPHG
jgi:chloride channel protein, CIC family